VGAHQRPAARPVELGDVGTTAKTIACLLKPCFTATGHNWRDDLYYRLATEAHKLPVTKPRCGSAVFSNLADDADNEYAMIDPPLCAPTSIARGKGDARR